MVTVIRFVSGVRKGYGELVRDGVMVLLSLYGLLSLFNVL